MYKIVKSIIKILLFLICFNISAEQDLSGQSDIVEAESVDNLSTEDKTTSLSEDQVLAEEFMTNISNDLPSFTPLIAQRCAMSGWVS